jgi:hypothetical protein
MNSKKLFFILCALLLVINGAGAAALVYGNKMLVKQNDKLTQLKVEASSLEDVQQSLVNAKKDIQTYADVETIAKTVVPQEKDQARTVREIVKLAADSGISISSVSFPSSSLGNKATTAPGAAASGPSANTQTQKVEGINNVERLEVTVSSDSSRPVLFTSFVSFLERLEQNRRTAQVTNINIQPVSDNRNFLTFTLTLNVYIKK